MSASNRSCAHCREWERDDTITLERNAGEYAQVGLCRSERVVAPALEAARDDGEYLVLTTSDSWCAYWRAREASYA